MFVQCSYKNYNIAGMGNFGQLCLINPITNYSKKLLTGCSYPGHNTFNLYP